MASTKEKEMRQDREGIVEEGDSGRWPRVVEFGPPVGMMAEIPDNILVTPLPPDPDLAYALVAGDVYPAQEEGRIGRLFLRLLRNAGVGLPEKMTVEQLGEVLRGIGSVPLDSTVVPLNERDFARATLATVKELIRAGGAVVGLHIPRGEDVGLEVRVRRDPGSKEKETIPLSPEVLYLEAERVAKRWWEFRKQLIGFFAGSPEKAAEVVLNMWEIGALGVPRWMAETLIEGLSHGARFIPLLPFERHDLAVREFREDGTPKLGTIDPNASPGLGVHPTAEALLKFSGSSESYTWADFLENYQKLMEEEGWVQAFVDYLDELGDVYGEELDLREIMVIVFDKRLGKPLFWGTLQGRLKERGINLHLIFDEGELEDYVKKLRGGNMAIDLIVDASPRITWFSPALREVYVMAAETRTPLASGGLAHSFTKSMLAASHYPLFAEHISLPVEMVGPLSDISMPSCPLMLGPGETGKGRGVFILMSGLDGKTLWKCVTPQAALGISSYEWLITYLSFAFGVDSNASMVLKPASWGQTTGVNMGRLGGMQRMQKKVQPPSVFAGESDRRLLAILELRGMVPLLRAGREEGTFLRGESRTHAYVGPKGRVIVCGAMAALKPPKGEEMTTKKGVVHGGHAVTFWPIPRPSNL